MPVYNGMPTMLDVAKHRGNDIEVGLIEESILVMPEMRVFPARTIKSVTYKTLVRTNYPTASFRRLNQGSARSKSTFENRLVECFPMDSQIGADKMVADAWEDGPAAYQMIESAGVVEAVLRRVAKSVYYGSSATAVNLGYGDPNGFPGFIDAYDTAAHEIVVGGATANTSTSVWAVRLGIKDVHLVLGNNSVLTLLPDWRIQTINDDSNNPYTAYVNNLEGWIGMQVGSVHSLVRAAGITTDVGYGMTDKIGQAMMELFPAGIYPDFFIMNRRSRRQLQQSRQPFATGAQPQNVIVPLPTDIEGIPILITDAIQNNEQGLY
jgi:major capsid protein gp7